MSKPFRFGVQLAGATTGPEWRAKARKVEDLGYSTLYIPDHFGDQWGPLVALTVAAEATTTLRVGTLVLDNDYRHPIVLAKELATLALTSEGRFVFGLGAGWMKSDYDQSGLAYDSPGARIDRMVEALAVFREAFAPSGAVLEGANYSVRDVVGAPRVPMPPLLIGGGGKRVLSIAAREADVVGVNPNLAAGVIGPEMAATATGDLYLQRLAWIREAAGDRFDELELQCLTFAVVFTEDRDTVLGGIGAGFGLSAEQAADLPLAIVGTVDQMVETLQERREKFGLNYIVVQEGALDGFAEVVSRLAGT